MRRVLVGPAAAASRLWRWTQIESPEGCREELEGNRGAEAEGDAPAGGHDGAVDGPAHSASIGGIEASRGPAESTADALHSEGLPQTDRLVQTIDPH